VISGKLTGPRSRTEKFIAGYIKHSGKPAIDIVDKGYSIAVKKLGVIGCQVRIIPPDVTPPDQFKILEIQAPPVAQEKPVEAAAAAVPAASVPAPVETAPEEKKSDLDQLLEAETPAEQEKPAPEIEEKAAEEAATPESAPEPAPESKPQE
jgi:small subunit ribosomal protein S3